MKSGAGSEAKLSSDKSSYRDVINKQRRRYSPRFTLGYLHVYFKANELTNADTVSRLWALPACRLGVAVIPAEGGVVREGGSGCCLSVLPANCPLVQPSYCSHNCFYFYLLDFIFSDAVPVRLLAAAPVLGIHCIRPLLGIPSPPSRLIRHLFICVYQLRALLLSALHTLFQRTAKYFHPNGENSTRMSLSAVLCLYYRFLLTLRLSARLSPTRRCVAAPRRVAGSCPAALFTPPALLALYCLMCQLLFFFFLHVYSQSITTLTCFFSDI